MELLSFLALVIACTLPSCYSIAVDMGTCSCVCGDTNGMVLTNRQQPGSFYQNIRGEKGDTGRSGKAGPQGRVGPIGERGEKGSRGDAGECLCPEINSRREQEHYVSCMALLRDGHTTSGIYSIRPSNFSSIINVFCDMESAGGGWTLVASVHENNIDGKCTTGDLWSSDQGNITDKYLGTGNWENFNAFGHPESATSADYKSPAYFSLESSDVMIWHVPNNVDIHQASVHASLKYYTNSGFLREYGGSLQSLYSKHYPLSKNQVPGAQIQGVTSVIAALNQSAPAIRALIPSFYNYVYDFDGETQNYIKDGGQDMYDTGNMLYYSIGSSEFTRVTYNQNYWNKSQGVNVLAATSHPFNALMWVGNEGRATETFALKVVSGTGADGNGNSATLSGSSTLGNLTLQYHAYIVYGTTDPSICEVFYYVSNARSWGSIPPTEFQKSPWTGGTDDLSHGVVVNGRPKSILMGYTVLSRNSGAELTDTQIRAALNKIMSVIGTFEKINDFSCSRLNESLVQPVTFLQGNAEKVISGIPPIAKTQSTAGFIQFRAFNPRSEPNALCPGVKTEACRPESVCIGGLNTMATDEKSCGDFAGWGGVSDTPTETEPSGSSRSLNDINSSILLFTRKQE